MLKRRLQKTADGSYTLYLPEMDEHYHSVNGAVQESEYVFLRMGLDGWLEQFNSTLPCLRILEFGLGTGLNALLTWRAAVQNGLHVSYYTIEKYPLELNVVSALAYGAKIWPDNQSCDLQLHEAVWNQDVFLSEQFLLHKIKGDFHDVDWPDHVDLVYFDAFAPDKQPGIWKEELFRRLFRRMNPGGILTTYCAKGAVRRMMQAVGFTVERLPGPPGKREMLRAWKEK